MGVLKLVLSSKKLEILHDDFKKDVSRHGKIDLILFCKWDLSEIPGKKKNEKKLLRCYVYLRKKAGNLSQTEREY